MRFPILITLLCAAFALKAQTSTSSPVEIEAAANKRLELRKTSPLATYPARCVGPTSQGGRITDLEVDPRNDRHWYIGFASGGLWETHNNGQTFTPIMDEQGAMGIGDLAISPANPDILWVGTGENNSSRSSYAGAGVLKSIDGGKSWTHCGLVGTQHIGRVIAHPTDPNTVWVASMGSLYTPNTERGVFLSTDGGKSWSKTLYIDDKTGVIDLVIDPHNPQQLWAATWERERKAWNFDGDGPGSGIHRSQDGGRTWTKLKGLPQGEKTGRIGIDASPAQKGLIYAVVDNQETEPKLAKEDTIAGLTARMIAAMSQEEFLKLDDKKLDKFIEESGYPDKYDAKSVKEGIREGKFSLNAFNNYFGDANKALFETAVKGSELYQSTDNGDTWTRINPDPLTGVFFTYGYYFGQIRVAPDNPKEIYIFGVPLIKSTDAGHSWSRVDTSEHVHVDHHVLWFNPKNPDHTLLGNDGGLYLSYDRGTTWTHLNNLPVGQFYTVHVDMAKPYNIYGGLQDNGVMKGSSQADWKNQDAWKSIGGGDGMFVVTDPDDAGVHYTGYQFGNYYRYVKGLKPAYITPRHDIGEEKYRWNWRTPLIASPHNHEILYTGAQYLFRSMDMGDTWEKLGTDLTTNPTTTGNVPFGTITCISESPLKFGQIWVGTDDGRVQLTTDGGNSWSDRSLGLPPGLWVSSLNASPHDKASATLTLTGYRSDDFHAYLFRTSDHGQTWQAMKGDLPDEACNVLLQDPQVKEMYYLGTDHSTYASTDGGAHWLALSSIPNVASYDMAIHPRELELVVGTHGRSVYVVDLKPLHQLAGRKPEDKVVMMKPGNVRFSKEWGKRDHPYEKHYEPELFVHYFLPAEAGKVIFKVLDDKGKELHRMESEGQQGFNVLKWDMKTTDKQKVGYLQPGKYKFALEFGKSTSQVDWELKE